IPIVTLFGLVWQSNRGDHEFATAERQGTAYIDALLSVELSLAESQVATVSGKTVSREKLTRAVERAAEADERYGEGLRTRERWAELRAKIEALSGRIGTDTDASLSAYKETTDLLLALVEKVRNGSRLIRDPSADTYYLQDAAAQELPEAIETSSRLVCVTLVNLRRPSADQSLVLADMLSLRAALTSNAVDLSDDVRQTVDATGSRTLGGNLLSPLDRFRRAVDALNPPIAAKQERAESASTASLLKSWDEVQAAAGALSTAMLVEISGLLVERLGVLDEELTVAVAVTVLAVLLALLPAVVAIVRDRRRRPETEGWSDSPSAGLPPPGYVTPTWRRPAEDLAPPTLPALMPALMPAQGDAAGTTTWERPGAAR
ncbi:MAG: hypothetical protein JXA67_21280, partial [Micromonosporaceae bacterium]|nr:hypothetical protein [Micromonosporaceae bacterium]